MVRRRRRRFGLLRRIFFTVAGALLCVAAGLAAAVWWSFPGTDGSAEIPGLSAPVDITLDRDGVPRIRAANERDAAAALGYLHARDRLAQMDLTRRLAAGELAELVGVAALPSDRIMRTLGIRVRAEADLAALPADTRAVLDAYAAGVNSWIAQRGRFAALEFVPLGRPRDWRPIDSVLWGKAMSLSLSGNWRVELARAALAGRMSDAAIDQLWPAAGGAGHPEALRNPIDPEFARRLAAAYPAFPARFTQPDMASNAWAVDGAHSATGAPLLAGDPHLGFAMPAIWYLARIEAGGAPLVGATAPGLPFLVIGHNGRIAWTFTTTGADTEDLFIETPVGPDTYATPDGPRPYARRTEIIHVRGAPDETLAVRETRHGPVVSDIVAQEGPILALAAAALTGPDTAAAGLHALNRAATRAEAGAAAEAITSPVQNMIVADGDGIALFMTGRIPIRRAGDGSRPAQGAEGTHDWTGFAAGAQLPRIVAPASGRLVNANERVAPPDFPVFLGRDWFSDWRARRIRELLDEPAPHTVARFAAMQTDFVNVFARETVARLRAVPASSDADRTALGLLTGWNGEMARNRPQPLLFNVWMRRFRGALLERTGVPGAAASPSLADIALSSGGEAYCGGSCDGLLAQTLTATVKALGPRFGMDPANWAWGRAHRAVFAHPILSWIPLLSRFTQRDIGAPGDDYTLFRASMRPGSLAAVHGAAFRAVYDLSDLERSVFVVTPGQSGHPFRRLAWNFVQRWRDGGTITISRQPDAISATIRLTPPP